MKWLKFALMLATLVAGVAFRSSAQITLPEIKIVASKYRYLNAADNKEMAQPVRMLKSQVASYDVTKSDFYNDDYDGYYVTFYIPDGAILASYDKEGKLLRTAEKFSDTKLPPAVRDAVIERFPKWKISHDVYRVHYYENAENSDKIFKVLLENGDKRMKLS